MKNTSISLGQNLDTFISKQVSSGRYGSASEVVRAGLRLLQENEERNAALKKILLDSKDHGFEEGVTYTSFMDRMKSRTIVK